MDVAVVGAGIIGCAIARELARRGAHVNVFDPRPVGRGATYASAGMLAPYVEVHHPGPLQDLIVRSLALYDDFVRDVEQECGSAVEYSRCGTMEIASVDREAATLQAIARSGVVEGARWVEAAELRVLEPALSPACIGGLLIPSHGYVDAPELAQALARAAVRAGAQFVSAAVESVHSGGGRPCLRIAGSEQPFDRVVVAAGSWSTRIAIGASASDAVYPVKGQLLRLKWNGPEIGRILWSADCYVVPRRGGHLLLGATMEDAGFNELVTQGAIAELRSAAARLLPAASGAELIDARAGLRPATSDALPVIGPSTVHEGVIFATGHFRNGVVLAPLTALIVADLIFHGPLDPTLDLLAPRRLAL